jgi:transcriptional regulator with XRE-family HTH domain
MRRQGFPYIEIAAVLQRQFDLNARQAFRSAHGWSQRDVAEEWSRRWPDEPKIGKSISYWELWPKKTGHEPSLRVIDRLAQLYQCSVADLLADLGNYRTLDKANTTDGRTAAAARELSSREAPRGWYVKSLITLVQLNNDTPTALEDRTIVATQDDLTEIDTTMSIPRHPDDVSSGHALDVVLLSGGRLDLREHIHESQFRHVITLARPLALGDEHQYRLSIRIPSAQLMMQHLVHIPLQRSEYYKLTVRFPIERIPARVWLLGGVPPAVLRDRDPSVPTVEPDRFGELTVEFRSLLQGQVYGLRWNA